MDQAINYTCYIVFTLCVIYFTHWTLNRIFNQDTWDRGRYRLADTLQALATHLKSGNQW